MEREFVYITETGDTNEFRTTGIRDRRGSRVRLENLTEEGWCNCGCFGTFEEAEAYAGTLTDRWAQGY